jgi:hypothetical protein
VTLSLLIRNLTRLNGTGNLLGVQLSNAEINESLVDIDRIEL